MPVIAQDQKVVPYTLADRDRLIKVKTEISSVRNEMGSLRSEMDSKFETVDARFESQQRQLDDIKTLFYLGFGILTSLSIFMLGYTIWDRRTALQPTIEKVSLTDQRTKATEEKVHKLIKALKKSAEKHPDLAELLITFDV